MRKATKKKKRDGNPPVQFRLPPKEIRQLDRIIKAFGYPSRAEFVREFVRVAISDDMNRVRDFLGKLLGRMAEAAQARLPGFLDEAPKGKGSRG
jgi:hypothetical protein